MLYNFGCFRHLEIEHHQMELFLLFEIFGKPLMPILYNIVNFVKFALNSDYFHHGNFSVHN